MNIYVANADAELFWKNTKYAGQIDGDKLVTNKSMYYYYYGYYVYYCYQYNNNNASNSNSNTQ